MKDIVDLAILRREFKLVGLLSNLLNDLKEF
jgi:hypothetical protein